MKKINAKELLIPVISLLLIATVASALLAVTNFITKDLIAENGLKAEIEARQIVFSEASSFSDNKSASYNGTEYSYVEAYDGEANIIGYVFMTATKGYGGDVTVMTGISSDGFVTGVKPLDLSETPGLGMNVQKEDFLAQFKGLVSGITVNKSTPSGNEIQAVSSATITSQAFTDSVNTAFEIFRTIVGGEG